MRSPLEVLIEPLDHGSLSPFGVLTFETVIGAFERQRVPGDRHPYRDPVSFQKPGCYDS